MMKFLSLSIALILFSSNAFGDSCVPFSTGGNPNCKKPVFDDGKLKFVNFCADGEECIGGKYCCPNGTKPSSYGGHSGQISDTGESLTCRCPDNTYYASDKACYDCPKNSVWGKTDYGYSPFATQYDEYYDSDNKEGCICPGDYKYYDTESEKCIATCNADVVKFSREGECCHPEKFYDDSDCLCTVDYLKYRTKCENDEEQEYCGWENSDPKALIDLGVLVIDEIDGYGLVRFSDDYGRKGTCANAQCNGELWCDFGIAEGAADRCCPCSDLKKDDGSHVNGKGECNYCPEGYIGGYYTTKELLDAVGRVENHNYSDGTCFKCADYGGVWYPGSDYPNSDEYTMNSYCVFCPDGTSPDGKGEPYNGVKECRCPYSGQEYLEDEELGLKGCFCPPGTYLKQSEGKCSPCGNSDGSYSNKYRNTWNNEGFCLTCSEQSPWAIRIDPEYPVALSEGNNVCVTCYYLYGAEKPYWNGTECVPCYEDESSGGVVWSEERKACISCTAENRNNPRWDDEYKQCTPCPDDKPLWSTTAYYDADGQPQSGCVSCYEHYQDSDEYWKADWNPNLFEYGSCPVRDGNILDCCTYCDNQTYDVIAGECVNCYNSTACQECIAGGTNPAECPCVHNDFGYPGTCMGCLDYCSASGNGEIGVLDEYGTCSCQNCPMGSVFNGGRCIADPNACPGGYDWKSSVGCCWDPDMNDGTGDCMEGSCPGTTYWNGNCCWNPDMGGCE